ncbi:hypothetical protein [Neisseria bacilliformis]|uniref:hypothetical protein n=1 Tax=Neisseria bacilliformis TaxID=267212 RepID=UPI0028E2B46B|nr:hypothetical protein [Neisseria bacilliformis]
MRTDAALFPPYTPCGADKAGGRLKAASHIFRRPQSGFGFAATAHIEKKGRLKTCY